MRAISCRRLALILLLSTCTAGQALAAAKKHPAAAPASQPAPPPDAEPDEVLPLNGTPPPAGGQTSVAVLEYRTAVEHLGDLPRRLVQTLTVDTSLRVVDPTEARRRLGPRLDADVAACSGASACLSRIGQRLGVGEVLFMAVSQLGDVVLALQRIDVQKRQVLGRVADALPAAGGNAVDEAHILDWLQHLYPPETFKRYGKIVIKTDVSGAQVYVNAKPHGQTPLHGPVELLAPGNYRVLVEKPRFLPFQASLSIMPDTTTEVVAKLVHEVQPTPWYKRWYVWAAVGGVAVVAVSSVAVYYGVFNQSAPDMTHVLATLHAN